MVPQKDWCPPKLKNKIEESKLKFLMQFSPFFHNQKKNKKHMKTDHAIQMLIA